MRSNPNQGKKMGKRTYTLKELVQRENKPVNKESDHGVAPVFHLVNLQEDLLDHDPKMGNQIGSALNIAPPKELSRHTNLALPIELLTNLIKKEVEMNAKQLGLENAELQAWIDLQVMTPKQTILALLRLARENGLDPLKEEVALALYEDTQWQAYITVQGYSKMLNRHPAFDGITFTQSEESSNGIPLWMECTIYRKDRSQPIRVREYFEEVKAGQAIWQKMPRRMLRHRVMQQCARLAIG
jgi:hypothetical protein